LTRGAAVNRKQTEKRKHGIGTTTPEIRKGVVRMALVV
jgi:hypothetical protein